MSAVDVYKNLGITRTIQKYGMDRNTLYLWRKEQEDEEKGWASSDDYTCPICLTPLLMGESWLEHLVAHHLTEDGLCKNVSRTEVDWQKLEEMFWPKTRAILQYNFQNLFRRSKGKGFVEKLDIT